MEELKVSMEVGDEEEEGKKGGRKGRAHRDFDDRRELKLIPFAPLVLILSL